MLGGQFDGSMQVKRPSDSFRADEAPFIDRSAKVYDISRGTHGTASFDGQPLKEVLPTNVHGGHGAFPGVSDYDRAYYTAIPKPGTPQAEEPGYDPMRHGWRWAGEAVANLGYTARDEARKFGTPEPVAPRGMVHHVRPVGRIGVDPVLNHRGGEAQMTADKLEVVDTEWIPSPGVYNKTGVQGTLPNENWNRYPQDPDIIEKRAKKKGFYPQPDMNARHLDGAQWQRSREKLFGVKNPVKRGPRQTKGQMSLDIP